MHGTTLKKSGAFSAGKIVVVVLLDVNKVLTPLF